jgi:hypothetical protein
MDKDNDFELIIDYINGELSAEQKVIFEERLTHDLDLVDSLRIQKEIHKAFLRMQIREQIKSIHEDAKILDQAKQNKTNDFSNKLEVSPSLINSENANKTKAIKNILIKIAAVFISIIFIGSLWIWFNHNSGNHTTIVNNNSPSIKNDSTYSPPLNKQNIENINSNQNIREESKLKRIDVVQLNPDVSFGFGHKNEVSKNIYSKRIYYSSTGINAMYRLNPDTLFLYLNAKFEVDEFLFEIQHDNESQSTLENGFYLMFDNVFYKLDSNNKLNKLILLENKSQVSELNKLIRRE